MEQKVIPIILNGKDSAERMKEITDRLETGKTYDATVLLADTGGKYVNYRVERKE